MGNTQSIDQLRPQIWANDLFADVMRGMYFTENGMMGKDSNNIFQIKDDLEKKKGDTITIGLTARLSGSGVSGDAELEGNEEAINAYSEDIAIDQKRFAVRLAGSLDEQKNAYDMRQDAKEKLTIRLQEFIEQQFFLKLAGCANTSLVDVNGVAYAADATWSNTGAGVPTADTGSGLGARYICANSGGLDALASTDLITPELLSKAKVKAKMANPKIVPLKIKGKEYYVCFIHPWQAYDLKNNATFQQARREAEVRGSENPIFTGALGIWDGIIIHEHEYVPFLDISVAGYNFGASASGTQAGTDAFRAILCGRQAGVFAKCKQTKGWVEKSFDYENKTGFATGIIGGIQKTAFNSKDYGVICIDTAATALA